jgi:hypothetical protein
VKREKEMRHQNMLCVLLVSLLALPGGASAANFSCEVDVKAVLPYADGNVNVLHSGRGDFTHICNLKTERAGVATATCAMWTSMLTQAMRDNRKVTFFYDHATIGSCSQLPIYSAGLPPVYVGYVKP